MLSERVVLAIGAFIDFRIFFVGCTAVRGSYGPVRVATPALLKIGLTGKMSRATVCAFLRREMETVMAKYQITAFKIRGRQFRCRERRKL
jgi:hypothetical protein